MIWFARAAWVLLPLTAGSTLQDALTPWSDAPAAVAAALTWGGWAAGLVALLAPRPWGFTILRVVAPVALVLTITSVPSADAGRAVLAVVSAALACLLALAGPVAQAAAGAAAYGDERRFPLRAPSGLLVAPLPLATLAVAAGIGAGPVMLADGRFALGVPTSIVGFAVAVLLGRSLHSLDRRWLVLVPAGLVVADPLSLTDPVLLPRGQVVGLGRTTTTRPAAGALDLRLGTVAGGVEIRLAEPARFGRREGRRDAELLEATATLVAPLRPAALLVVAAEQGLPAAVT